MKQIKTERQFINYVNKIHNKFYITSTNISDILLHIFTVIGNGVYLSDDGFIVDCYKPLKGNLKELVNPILDKYPNIELQEFANMFTGKELNVLFDSGYLIRISEKFYSLLNDDNRPVKTVIRNSPLTKIKKFTKTDFTLDSLYNDMMANNKDFYPGDLNYSIFNRNDKDKNIPSWFIDIGINTLNAAIKCIEDTNYDEQGYTIKDNYIIILNYLKKLKDTKNENTTSTI